MSVEEIKALERRWAEEWNKGKAAAMAIIDELHATDYVSHSSTGDDISSLNDYKQENSDLYSMLPDIQLTIDDMVVEGDKIVTRWTLTGTHTGEHKGIAPTNKKVTVWGISIDRVAGGKFVETWERYDTLGFMQQLSLVPTPGQG